MQAIELSDYEVVLLRTILDREIKETRKLTSRMVSDDPFKPTLSSNIEYLTSILGKLGTA